MKVYKYVGERYALENLALRRLKVSKPLETNDPFELCPFKFTSEGSRSRFRKFLASHTMNRGFVSFSENCESPSMWANYADNHQGICLGFETSEMAYFTAKPQKFLTKINYPKEFREFPVAAFLPENPDILDGALKYAMETKSFHWRYEEEYRAYLKDKEVTPNSKITFFPFGKNLVLKEIIFGFKTKLDPSDISALLQDPSIQLFSAKPSDINFSMTKEPLILK